MFKISAEEVYGSCRRGNILFWRSFQLSSAFGFSLPVAADNQHGNYKKRNSGQHYFITGRQQPYHQQQKHEKAHEGEAGKSHYPVLVFSKKRYQNQYFSSEGEEDGRMQKILQASCCLGKHTSRYFKNKCMLIRTPLQVAKLECNQQQEVEQFILFFKISGYKFRK